MNRTHNQIARAAIIVATSLVLLAPSSALIGQESWVQLDVGLAAGLIEAGGCGGDHTSVIPGITARSATTVALSTGIDFIHVPEFEEACAGPIDDVRGENTYEGPRLRVGLAYAITVSNVRSELGAEGGTLRTRTQYGATFAEPHVAIEAVTWEPWYAGTLDVSATDYPIGLTLELGRHRTRYRYYNRDEVVFEGRRWDGFGAVGLRVRIVK
jgi:hypothetical protein